MKKGIAGKNKWALFLLMLSGIVIGGFIGVLLEGIPGVGWLNYGQMFGLTNPVIFDLGIIVITFGFSIKVTMASIIGVLIAVLIYKFI